MHSFTDQVGNTISFNAVPRRIISLVPSQTELLYDLGLDAAVIGITKFCIHPAHWFRNKTRVGGTKALHIDKIIQLQPDLVIANKEENVREQVEALSNIMPVWTSDVNDLASAIDMIRDIGAIVDRTAEAESIIGVIEEAFSNLQPVTPPRSAAYLIWKDPYMTIGGDTFIHDMMRRCGFENIFAGRGRYPEVTIEKLTAAKPGFILLSSEPYPFKQEHAEELSRMLRLPGTKILLVDGEMFSWYGSRLQHAPAYFRKLLADH